MSEYSDFSNSRLLNEKEFLSEKIEGAGGTAFMRMLQELQISQIELELQSRQLKEAHHQLEETRGRYADLYDFAPLAYFTFDSHGAILEMNFAGSKLLGLDKHNLLGTPFVNYMARHDRSHFLHYVRTCILGDSSNSVEFELELPDGKSIRVQTARVATQTAGMGLDACRMAFIEVTEQRIAELKLRLTSKVLESTQEGIMLTDAQKRIVAINPAFLKSTGYSSEEIIGYTPSKLNSGHHDDAFYKEMHASFNANDGWQGEIWNRRKNGDVFPEWVNIQVIRKGSGEVDCYIAIYSDISNQEEIKQRLKELAYYDALTGLANRSLLYDRLQLAIVRAKRNESSLAVLFLDLDHFKEINDTFGHGVGDFVLKEAASRLAACTREGDTLCRLGGDEFVAILPDILDREVPAQIAERMVAALEKPCVFDNVELRVTISIGIGVFPEDGGEMSLLLNHADIAMYAAKKMGRSNFQYYDATMSG